MRLLFAFVGGRGHFDPLVPIARAAIAAGYTVAVTAGHSMIATVESAGFTAIATTPGQPVDDEPPERRPLLEVDIEREERDLRERFVLDGGRRRATGMLARIGEWRPDVVVCDEVDFGSIIAAERLGVPYATVVVLAAGGMIRPDVVGKALDEVRAEHGLPSDPELSALSRHLVLVPAPPSFRDPTDLLPPTAHHVRTFGPDPTATAATPPWHATRPDEGAVYFTLGTIFNLESGDLFQRVLAGLRDHPGDVVVTTGAEIDSAEFGPQPANIHIERFLPQSAVLSHVDVVVSHGGSGAVLGALAHGRPMVLLAMGADQPRNAVRCEALGVARVLDPVRATPHDVREAVRILQADPSYRQAAERLRDEMAGMPGPDQAVARLVGLAVQPA